MFGIFRTDFLVIVSCYAFQIVKDTYKFWTGSRIINVEKLCLKKKTIVPREYLSGWGVLTEEKTISSTSFPLLENNISFLLYSTLYLLKKSFK